MASTGGTTDSPATTAASMAATRGRTLRLSIPLVTWFVMLLGVVVVVVARELYARAHRPIGWAIAAVVIAAALEPVVSRLASRLARPVAVIGVIVGVAAVVGSVAWLTLRDLDEEYERLQAAIPEAATTLEESPRFGTVARDFQLVDRAQELADDLRAPSSALGREVAAGVGGAFVVLILTLFMLAWGPRLAGAAFGEITDVHRRRRLERIVDRALRGAQRYVNVVVVAATVVFGAAWLGFWLLDVPGAAPLALLAALASTIPTVGLAVGVVPAAALQAVLVSPWTGLAIIVGGAAVQFAHQQVLDRWTRGLYARPGSAVMLISFLIGYELYGAGGALVGAALAVFAVGLIDSLAEAEGEPVLGDGADEVVGATEPVTG